MNEVLNRNMKQDGEVIILDDMPRRLSNVPPKSWDSITVRENTVYITGDLIIDRHGKIVFKEGKILDLTPTEYAILVHLVENVTLYCSRSNLKEMVSSRFRHTIADNTLSKHIHRTRSKLQQTQEMKYVITQNSRGYKWNLPVCKKYLSRGV